MLGSMAQNITQKWEHGRPGWKWNNEDDICMNNVLCSFVNTDISFNLDPLIILLSFHLILTSSLKPTV